MKLYWDSVKKICKRLKEFFVDLLFPVCCVGCDEEGGWLCGVCFREVEFVCEQACFKCGKSNDFGEVCDECKEDDGLDGVIVFGCYRDDILKKLIKRYKYYFVRDLSKVIGEFMNYCLKNLLNQVKFLNKRKGRPIFLDNLSNVVLMSVPLHARRERWRGFNQAQLLAHEVASYFCLEVDDLNLVRVKYGKAQAKMDLSQRVGNIRGSFSWNGEKLDGRSVLLIDDVVTSGATLSEIARVLKENGAGEVWGLCVARG